MSKPIRYGLADADLGHIHPQADGHLVMHSDYAALAAENERLRKAGDGLQNIILNGGGAIQSLVDWKAAKEGGAK